MSKRKILFTTASVGISMITVFGLVPSFLRSGANAPQPAHAASIPSLFVYTFNSDGSLPEAGSMSASWSPYWWVNSGAYLNMEGGVGKTVQGSLPASDPWRLLYGASNPTDTDGGYHPQNIFRLVTRGTWQNFRQTAYMKITKDNLSSSSNRNASNGLLLFNRYRDGNNLYYTGVRVDGQAVVKKKKNGQYYTVATKKIFGGTYNRSSAPNLLPKDTWIGIRSEVRTLSNGSVEISLYTDVGKTGTWKLALRTYDDGKSFGGAPLLSGGYGGIRTDFMDVVFEDYRNEPL